MLRNQQEGLRENHAIYQSGYFKLETLHREAETYRLLQLASHETPRCFFCFHVLRRQLRVLYDKVFQPPLPLSHLCKKPRCTSSADQRLEVEEL